MDIHYGGWRIFIRAGTLVTLLAFLVLCTIVFRLDARRINPAPVYVYQAPPSGQVDPGEAAIGDHIYPISGYLIEIGELKGVNHFESSIRLNDFHFVHENGQRDDRTISEECELSKISLYFYKNSHETSSSGYREVDGALNVFEGPPVKCYALGGDRTRAAQTYSWVVLNGTPGSYPFDEYTLRLDPEEVVIFSGTATNSRPELIKVTATDPRFNISSFVIDKDAALVTLRRPLLLRVLAVYLLAVLIGFIIYLLTISSNTQLLPGILGYVAGVWGIRTIISSSAPLFPTLTDYLALLLLGLVAWIALWKLTRPNKPDETINA